MGKLLDLKELSGSTYWSWSSRISRDSERSLAVSSWSEDAMAQKLGSEAASVDWVGAVGQGLDPHEELLQRRAG